MSDKVQTVLVSRECSKQNITLIDPARNMLSSFQTRILRQMSHVICYIES